MSNQKINSDGKNLIKYFEGLKLKAYPDPKGILTIGYGSTEGVTPGMMITAQEAEKRLTDELSKIEKFLNVCIPINLNSNQFSALCSFVYNVGSENFLHSEMFKLLKSGDLTSVAGQFLRWDHLKGSISAGLLRRRESERALFLKPVKTS